MNAPLDFLAKCCHAIVQAMIVNFGREKLHLRIRDEISKHMAVQVGLAVYMYIVFKIRLV